MRKVGILMGLLLLLAVGGCQKADGLTEANFDQVVLQSDKPVLVDFWGPS